MSSINPDTTTHESTVSVNAWDLDDLHLNQLYQLERIAHVIEVAKLASESNNVAQLKGAINLMMHSLNGTVSLIEGDHNTLELLIKEGQVDAQTKQPVSA